MNDDHSKDRVAADSPRRVHFGPFEADFRTQELLKHGTRLKLSGQPFQVLEMLVMRSGALVTRDELQKRLGQRPVHRFQSRSQRSREQTARSSWRFCRRACVH